MYLRVMRLTIMSIFASSGMSLFLVTTSVSRSLLMRKKLWPCSKVMPKTSFVSVGAHSYVGSIWTTL